MKHNNSSIKRGNPPAPERCIKNRVLMEILTAFDEEADIHYSVISPTGKDSIKQYGKLYWVFTGMLNGEMTRLRVVKRKNEYLVSRIVHETVCLVLK